MNLEGYISVKEYAHNHGISVQAVYQRVWRGTIDYVKIGTLVLIKED